MLFPPESIVSKSGQSWKFGAGVAVQFAGLGTFYWCMSGDEPSPLLALGSLAVGLVTTFASWFCVKCERCGARWLWMAVSTQSTPDWLPWLGRLTECPKCGYGGDPTTEQPPP